MGTIYIQLEDRLQKVSADVTQESIENALGYTPSDFSGEFQDINNNPIEDDGVGTLSFTDDKGYVITKIDASGTHSVDFITAGGEHILSDKANATYVDEMIELVSERITEAENSAFSGYFKDLLENPVDVTEEDNLSFTDDKGYVIAKIDASGVKSVDFIAGDHVLSDKVSQSELQEVVVDFEEDLGEAVYEINETIDSLTINDLKGSPINDNNDGNLSFVDPSGHVIAKIDASGVKSVDFIAGDHVLSDKVSQSELQEVVVDFEEDLGEAVYEINETIDSLTINDLKGSPINDNNDGNLSFVDPSGHVIAKIDASGVKSVDFIAGDHVLSDKVSQSEVAGLYVEHANEADHAIDSDKLGNIKASEYILRKDVSTNFITKDDASILYVDEDELVDAISDASDIINDRIDKLSISDLYESPIDDKVDDAELYIMDASGNVITKIDASGIHSIDFITAGGVHKLSDKVDWVDVPDLHVSHADTADDASNAKMANDSKKLGNKDASLYAIKSEVAQTYLTKTDASNTYITINDASSTFIDDNELKNALKPYLKSADASNAYLTKTDASSTYLTKTDASNTYITIEDATKYIDADELANGSVKYATNSGDAKQLGGKDASLYALKGDVPGIKVDSASVADVAKDASLLEGHPASYFAVADNLKNYLTTKSASDTYLTKADASNTYLGKVDASNTYLKIDTATDTYLTKDDAASTYIDDTELKKALESYSTKNDVSVYLTKDDASNTYITIEDSGKYVDGDELTKALEPYLTKTDASNKYIDGTELTAALEPYLTKDEASSTYIDETELANTLKPYIYDASVIDKVKDASVKYATTAGNTSQLDGHSASYFAVADDLKSYLTTKDASTTYLTKDDASQFITIDDTTGYIDGSELANALKPYVLDASLTGYKQPTDTANRNYKITKDGSTYYVNVPWEAASLSGDLEDSVNALLGNYVKKTELKDATVAHATTAGSADVAGDSSKLEGHPASDFVLGSDLTNTLKSYPTKTDVSVYLTKTDASNTYITKDDADGYVDENELADALKPYLKSDTASNTYLTKTGASNTYLTIEDSSMYIDGDELKNVLKPYVLDASLIAYEEPNDLTNRKYKITKDGNHYYVYVPWESASLSGDLEDSVNALLGNYVKKTELKDATVAHATTAGSADVAGDSSKLEGHPASDFVLDTELTNVLKSYPTKTDVSVYLTKNDASNTYLKAEELNAILKDASVNYANKAGDADTLDGKHASSFALDASLQDVSTMVSGINELVNDFNGDISDLYNTKADKDDLEPYVTKSSLTGFEEIDTDNNKNYKISENDDGTYYVHVPWGSGGSGGSGGDLTDYVKYASTVEDGTWDFIDDGSRTIMRVDKLGVQSVDFIAGGHILSQKANIDEYSDPNDWWAYGD